MMTTSCAPDDDALTAAINGKTKPPGSLGRIEALAHQLGRVQGTLHPTARRCRLTIFAGDHGMAEHGVSAYPQSVTSQMVRNFLTGGAAANVIAAALGIEVRVVDTGVVGPPIEHPGLISRRVAAGTRNALTESAMSRAEFDTAWSSGVELGADDDHEGACFGEMGIGNTASASLVCAKILGMPVRELVGRGTGLDDAGLAAKRSMLECAAERTASKLPADLALIEYGGFELVTMAGAMVGAAGGGKIVLVDGFIATAAALAAVRVAPETHAAMVFAHQSAEAGHVRVLAAMQAAPLLSLGMRLGEGTGALLAWPLVQAAAAVLSDMASFESAGVSGPA